MVGGNARLIAASVTCACISVVEYSPRSMGGGSTTVHHCVGSWFVRLHFKLVMVNQRTVKLLEMFGFGECIGQGLCLSSSEGKNLAIVWSSASS